MFMCLDKEKIGRIYEENRPFMFGVAFNALDYNVEDAEDAVQDAAVKMMKQRKDPPLSQERGFAYTMARYAAGEIRDYQTAQCRDTGKAHYLDTVDHETDEEKPITHGNGGLEVKDIDRQVSVKSAEQQYFLEQAVRDAVAIAPSVVMMEAVGYSLKEIAETTGEKQKKVDSQIWRWQQEQKRRRA